MARIRTIKPDFFRHEELQDLEIKNPGKYPMMVFAALWGHCDKDGVFEFRPKTLKLDILPFLPFEMSETLDILLNSGFIEKYTVNGKAYGIIRTFTEHQRINGKESQEPSKYPKKTEEATGKQQGSNREATETTGREGKGREGKGEPKTLTTFSTFLESCKTKDEKPIPDNDVIFEYMDKVGIGYDFAKLHWDVFVSKYQSSSKKYKDWRAVFRNSVKGNWYKLWFIDNNGVCMLTTTGKQAEKEFS